MCNYSGNASLFNSQVPMFWIIKTQIYRPEYVFVSTVLCWLGHIFLPV